MLQAVDGPVLLVMGKHHILLRLHGLGLKRRICRLGQVGSQQGALGVAINPYQIILARLVAVVVIVDRGRNPKVVCPGESFRHVRSMYADVHFSICREVVHNGALLELDQILRRWVFLRTRGLVFLRCRDKKRQLGRIQGCL